MHFERAVANRQQHFSVWWMASLTHSLTHSWSSQKQLEGKREKGEGGDRRSAEKVFTYGNCITRGGSLIRLTSGSCRCLGPSHTHTHARAHITTVCSPQHKGTLQTLHAFGKTCMPVSKCSSKASSGTYTHIKRHTHTCTHSLTHAHTHANTQTHSGTDANLT